MNLPLNIDKRLIVGGVASLGAVFTSLITASDASAHHPQPPLNRDAVMADYFKTSPDSPTPTDQMRLTTDKVCAPLASINPDGSLNRDNIPANNNGVAGTSPGNQYNRSNEYLVRSGMTPFRHLFDFSNGHSQPNLLNPCTNSISYTGLYSLTTSLSKNELLEINADGLVHLRRFYPLNDEFFRDTNISNELKDRMLNGDPANGVLPGTHYWSSQELILVIHQTVPNALPPDLGQSTVTTLTGLIPTRTVIDYGGGGGGDRFSGSVAQRTGGGEVWITQSQSRAILNDLYLLSQSDLAGVHPNSYGPNPILPFPTLFNDAATENKNYETIIPDYKESEETANRMDLNSINLLGANF